MNLPLFFSHDREYAFHTALRFSR